MQELSEPMLPGLVLTRSGLMVPMVNTAKEAESVVSASKFPPTGVRGQGSPFAALAHGMSTPEYINKANETILIGVQIETAEAVSNVDSIAAVPGLGMSMCRIRIISSYQNCCLSVPMISPFPF
jgi:2-keto-3-deoxy-L-rhamnonate aldolase RhmA